MNLNSLGYRRVLRSLRLASEEKKKAEGEIMVNMLTDKDKVFVLQHDVRIRDEIITELKQAVRDALEELDGASGDYPLNLQIVNATTILERIINPVIPKRIMQEGEK